MSLRILVCGGRDFSDSRQVYWALDRTRSLRGISLLIHGGARGADAFAASWAEQDGTPILCFEADWETYGRGAGPVRNQRMIDEGRPDGVIAFAGGRGTADMVSRAEKAGIKVWKP